jgi:hypothetical protein
VGLEVVESVALETTIASVAKSDAIDELLLGELLEGTVLDLDTSLEGEGGGERPAGTASALVLDGLTAPLFLQSMAPLTADSSSWTASNAKFLGMSRL